VDHPPPHRDLIKYRTVMIPTKMLIGKTQSKTQSMREGEKPLLPRLSSSREPYKKTKKLDFLNKNDILDVSVWSKQSILKGKKNKSVEKFNSRINKFTFD
jgi:hypothetical protein